MEKNIIDLFLEKVTVELKKELQRRKAEELKKKPEDRKPVASAMVRYSILDALRSLGAKSVAATVTVNKDHTWLRTEAQGADGFFYRFPSISQRRQSTRAELAGVKELDNEPLIDAVCIAGIYEEGEDYRISYKWDTLITGDGEAFAFSGKVRKWHEDTQTYDGPVAE